MSQQDREKRASAKEAAALVEDGMTVGLGTGSTAAHLIERLGERIRQGLRMQGVPTSRQTAQLARERDIPLTSLDTSPQPDLTIDGADEVDGSMQLIKGGGGALLREKIVAAASRRMVVIVDSGKLVKRLGAFPLPVEVVPFGWKPAARQLERLGGRPVLRQTGSEQPFRSDEGNYILDCHFEQISDADELAQRIDQIVGVVEHGLFINLCDLVLVGRGDSVVRISRGG